ncbi:MAG: hypothetical protein AB7T31_04485 [Gemmatimonadales bacterium]
MFRTARRSARRLTAVALSTAALVVVSSPAVQAQSPSPAADAMESPVARGRWELIVPGGMLIPTGDQRDAVQRGGLTAAQLSYAPRPSLAFTATFAWARSRDVAAVDRPKLDVFMYDVGVEVRAPRWIGDGSLTLSPFAGIGGGARSYNYRSLHVDATHNLAGYASAGGEIGMGRAHLRIEARDYVAGFEALDGRGAGHVRNDMALLIGLRFGTR